MSVDRESLKKKLHPSRFSAMSGLMAAIVGFIIDEPFTEPSINQLVVTSDGHLLATNEGDIGANQYVGNVGQLVYNLENLFDAADLTKGERLEAAILVYGKIPQLNGQLAETTVSSVLRGRKKTKC